MLLRGRMNACFLFFFFKVFILISFTRSSLSSSKAWQRSAWRGSELARLPSQSSRGPHGCSPQNPTAPAWGGTRPRLPAVRGPFVPVGRFFRRD